MVLGVKQAHIRTEAADNIQISVLPRSAAIPHRPSCPRPPSGPPPPTLKLQQCQTRLGTLLSPLLRQLSPVSRPCEGFHCPVISRDPTPFPTPLLLGIERFMTPARRQTKASPKTRRRKATRSRKKAKAVDRTPGRMPVGAPKAVP